MYTVSPIFTRSNARPLTDTEPFPPLSRARERSSVKCVPLETRLPATWAELALVAAALAAAKTWSGGFEAMPFGGAACLGLPQPARSAAVRTRARAETRIGGARPSDTSA